MMITRLRGRRPIDRNDAAAVYEASGDIERDALDWLATGTDIPADVVELVVHHYRHTSLYDTKVDDIWEGH